MASELDPTQDEITARRAALGRELRERRQGLGITQKQLARQIGYSRSAVANAEIGYQHADRDFWERCDRALAAGGVLNSGHDKITVLRQARTDARALAARSERDANITQRLADPAQARPDRPDRGPNGPETDDGSLDEVNRRAFLLGSTATVTMAAASSLASEPWQRLASSLRGRTKVDQATVKSLATLNGTLSAMFQPVAPRLLLGPVQSHLSTITSLLDFGLAPMVRRRLTSLAAETTILVGWLNKETGDDATAQQCFTTAVTAAVEAEDHDLAAYAVASASTLNAFRSSPGQSLGLLTSTKVRGAELTRANTSTRIWFACLEAEVQTRTGDRTEAFRALDRADELLGRLDPVDSPRPVLGHFDRASLTGERGITSVRLNSGSEAAPALETALDALTDYPKTQSRVLTNSARAHLQRGNVDQAAAAAIRSLDIARQTGSWVGTNDVRVLRHDFEPWVGSSAVQELDNRLADN